MNKVKEFVLLVQSKDTIVIHILYQQLINIQNLILKKLHNFEVEYDKYGFVDVKKINGVYKRKRGNCYVTYNIDKSKRSNWEKYLITLLFEIFSRFLERDLLLEVNYFNIEYKNKMKERIEKATSRKETNQRKLVYQTMMKMIRDRNVPEREIIRFDTSIGNNVFELLKNDKQQIPSLFKLAKKLFSIVPSESENERTFSLSKNVLTPVRRKMKCDLFESLIILNQINNNKILKEYFV